MTGNMCRVCLCGDRRMCAISNTVLQEMWEKLTNAQFNTKYGKPCHVCYICCAQLKKCSQLRERALKAEEWLTSFFNNASKQPQESISSIPCLTNDLDSMSFIKELFQFEYKQHTDTVEHIKRENEEHDQEENDNNIKEDAMEEIKIVIKEEPEECDQEEDDINIKEEEDSCQEDNPDAYDVEPGTRSDDIAPPRCMMRKDILQSKVDIILERIDIEAPARKLITIEVPQKAKQIGLDKKTEDKNNSAKRSSSKNLSVYMDVENSDSKPATVSTFNCSVVNKISPNINIQPENVTIVNNKTPTSKLSHNDARNTIFKQCLEKSGDVVAPNTTKNGCDQGNTSNGFNRIAPKNNFPCPTCQYVCFTKREFNKHLRKHTGEKSYSCDLCNYACTKKKSLKSHLMYIHTKEKNFACHICEYKCVTKWKLNRHLRTHTGEKPYTCDLCDYACSEKGTLQKHIKFKHRGEKNFSCNICEYKCSTNCDLNRHFRKHTGEKPYTCNLCDYACSLKSTLKDHLKYKHTKEKNFACHICQYKCVLKRDLNKHLRKHMTEEPHTVDLCDYASSTK